MRLLHLVLVGGSDDWTYRTRFVYSKRCAYIKHCVHVKQSVRASRMCTIKCCV